MTESSKYDSSDIINFIIANRKILIIVGFLSILLSVGVAYYITPLYRSTAVFFPTELSSISKAILSTNATKSDILQLGDEEVIEQYLQMLSSEIIRNRIISKYDLMNHYKIPKNSKYRRTLLQKKYDDYITFKKTKFQSVKIEVLDPSPDTAALIANDILNLLDSAINKMQYERSYKAFKEVEKQYNGLKQLITNAEDTLKQMGELGIVDYKSQSRALADAYANAMMKGNKQVTKEIKQQLDTLAKYGPKYYSLTNYIEFQREQLSLLHKKYIEAQTDVELNLPHKFVVYKAEKPERKAYPIRWLIVLVVTFSALLLTTMLLLLFEKKKER